jgi:D-alanyl-D-alanine carboxypeptidase/Putative peptidoglycan binding domain
MFFNNYGPNHFGWAVPAAADIVPFRYAGVSFPGGVHRAAEPVFRRALDLLVPHLRGGLKAGCCWGYTHRNVTGGTSLSFHAFGLALDINAPDNPYSASGAAHGHTMPDNAAGLLRPLGMEWGGAWTKPRDYMHIEFHGNPDEAAALGTAHRDHLAANAVKAQAATVTAYAHGAKPGSRTLTAGASGDDVAFVQRFIGAKWCGKDDGVFGPGTRAGVLDYQRMRGLAADGVVGSQTWHSMGVR